MLRVKNLIVLSTRGDRGERGERDEGGERGEREKRDDFMSRRLSLWSLSPVSVGHPEDNLLFYWIINFIVTLNKLGRN